MNIEADNIREQARKSIKRKREFWQFLVIAIVVSAIVTGVWYLTGEHKYFWPAWVYFGLTIGLFFSAIDAYGPWKKVITEDQIDAEIRKLSGK